MALKTKHLNKPWIDTFEGLHVIINNKKGWKYYGNCAGKWKTITQRRIRLNQGSTPVSVISVKENGDQLREYKLKLIWESVFKKRITEITDACLDELSEYDADMMDVDGESYIPPSRTFADYAALDFAISDETGLSCHTTSLLCREQQELIEENVLIESPHESGPLSTLKNEYQIEIKLGFTFMDDVLCYVD